MMHRKVPCIRVDGTGELLNRSSLGIGSASQASVHFDLSPKGKMCILEAAELAKRALCLGVYLVPESCECMSGFFIGSFGLRPAFCNNSIQEWREKYFIKAGEAEARFWNTFREQTIKRRMWEKKALMIKTEE
ncbi:OLC1v1006404C1 [Oldenlandia corymbosa var. corymbosa]|uniref:OLC1v1006404C1 n=1 Tax=Oldenlandia corymbosa var. corymbosa TaxID=529605 RepID=A0AAV1DIC1_OLDCO|nr:OLC1v1006404C1 [Oldenlandia corymbosa var. corymbosa]